MLFSYYLYSVKSLSLSCTVPEFINFINVTRHQLLFTNYTLPMSTSSHSLNLTISDLKFFLVSLRTQSPLFWYLLLRVFLVTLIRYFVFIGLIVLLSAHTSVPIPLILHLHLLLPLLYFPFGWRHFEFWHILFWIQFLHWLARSWTDNHSSWRSSTVSAPWHLGLSKGWRSLTHLPFKWFFNWQVT